MGKNITVNNIEGLVKGIVSGKIKTDNLMIKQIMKQMMK